VERARSRLGESRYRILTNNCAHFCAWALRDERQSRQVAWIRAIPRTLCRALRIQFSGDHYMTNVWVARMNLKSIQEPAQI
jgi:hypothetical protein